MEHRNRAQHIGQQVHNHVLIPVVLCQGRRAGGMDGRKSLHNAKLADTVIRSLRQAHRTCQRETQLVVVVGLAAPGRTVHHRFSVLHCQHWAVVIELLKNLIHLPVTQTSGIGELSNFITGVIYVVTAGLIYRKVRTRKGAAISLVASTIALAVIAVPINAFITLPLYGSVMGFPLEAIIGMSAGVNPLVKDKISLLFAVFVPFNLFKGIVVGLITFFVYKPISKLINKTYDKTHEQSRNS